MKPASLLLFLTLTIPLAAQTTKQIETICGAPALGAVANFHQQPTGLLADPLDPARPSVSAMSNAAQRLFKDFNFGGNRIVVVLISSSAINASTAYLDTDLSVVCIPSGIADFIGNEDELAFVIGHEMGHALNPGCSTPPLRQKQIVCETHADEIGFKLMRAAGYSPYAAAGAFGRLEMYYGDTSTGISGMFRQLASDHPITPNRIANMRRLLLTETHP